MRKRFFTAVHSVAGLVAGIFILLLSVSGTVLLFHNEIDGIQMPTVGQAKITVSVNACYTVLKNRFPAATVSSCQLPENNLPYSFFIYDTSFNKGKSAQEIFIDPSSGKILGTRGGSGDWRHNFVSWLAKFHNSFHAGKKGEWLLGVIALVFVLSLITGIVLYRKNIVAALFFRKAVFKRTNLHQLIGVYALLFNLMMGVTGFWMQRYVFKKDFYTANTWTMQNIPSPPLSFNFDSAYRQVQKQHPAFTGYVVYFAQNSQGKTALYGSNETNAFIHSKKFADVIMLDSSGAISKTRFVNENSSADYYDIVNSQLHMGKYGGRPIQLLYGIFGITSALLSITGFGLWLKRKKRNNR